MLPWIVKIHTLMECGPAVYEASVDISSKTTIIIGCDRSYDIRIIADIIVRCQEEQLLQ